MYKTIEDTMKPPQPKEVQGERKAHFHFPAHAF